ncbi:MAG: hypothetical protein ACLP8S_19630 [Solirubrobacteraceae bacterium]
MNDQASVMCVEEIAIDAGVAIGAQILDSDVQGVIVPGQRRGRTAPVRIGDSVSLGTSSVVLMGVSSDSQAVVAAGAVVTSDVASHALVGDNLARVIRVDVEWAL